MDAHVSKSSQLESLHDYLKFKARGLARLLLMELNSFVEWEDGQPYLTLREADLARIEFYAGLQRILDDFLAHVAERHPFSVAIDVDRWRLGAYYVTDRILKTIGTTFTVDELVSGEGRLSIDPLLVLSSRKVEELLEFLVRNEVVERVRGHAADETYFGDVPTAQVSVYRVAEDVGHKLASFARINEHERAELLGDEVSPGFAGQPWADSDIGILVAGRYELRDELDRGGMGRVYRAYDRLLARDVAVKMLDVPELLADELMRERFTRKANLALGLEHPNIVATFDVFTDEQQRPGIAMQFVDGISLAQVLKQSRLNVTDAVRIADALLDALAYLEKRGIARLDLKPSRILVDAALHPIIIDVGLAKHQDADVDRGEAFTQAGVLVGTPAYLAPEQIAGGHIDIRTDMYTLALIVCELITGRPVRSDEGIYEILHAATEQVDLSGLPASPELREVLQKALSLDPAARYESAAEMRAVLAGVPEASYGFGLQPVAASPPRDQPMAAAGSGVP
jgi:serine/threonine-protein kinase